MMFDLLKEFERHIMPEPNSGCHIWLGSLNGEGYGCFAIEKRRHGRRINAHRWIWEQKHGPIPNGLDPDHLCRVRCCVNDNHIELVTRQVNVQRGVPYRPDTKKSHCIHGHELTPDNTQPRKDGGRRCLQCRRRAKFEWRERMRARRRLPRTQRCSGGTPPPVP